MTHQQELVKRFKAQTEFATGYSDLYAALFEIVGRWIEDGTEIGTWLIEVSRERNPFDVTLLTMAGLHEAVLSKHHATSSLADYYPSAGGNKPIDAAFESHLAEAIPQLKPSMGDVIRTATVQTNETGRGSIWLMPLGFTGWQTVELLDLGASAGLNLLAEQRCYQFVSADSAQPIIQLGSGEPEGLVVKTRGAYQPLASLSNGNLHLDIISRTGVDLNPFPIDGISDEIRLTSYVWADQTERIERLQQALVILRQNKRSAAPVRLEGVTLPHELPPFLAQLPSSKHPLVIYNTYITQYFKEQRPALNQAIADWAQSQARPVLWLQWEPHVDWMGESVTAEEFGWCAWTADVWLPSAADVWLPSAEDAWLPSAEDVWLPSAEDVWLQETHQRFLLGWVHPHGLQARFLEGLTRFRDYFSKS